MKSENNSPINQEDLLSRKAEIEKVFGAVEYLRNVGILKENIMVV